MGKFKDLTGMHFGRLTVLRYVSPAKHYRQIWECTCECGNITNVNSLCLRSGTTSSCGCLKREMTIKSRTKHGEISGVGVGGRVSSEYGIWVSMKSRCYKSTDSSYPSYGGRGIAVCDRWRNSFSDFLSDMGRKPEGMSLDRIDNDGDYCPGNCRWATEVDQQNNKRNNHVIVIDGVQKTLTEWSRHFGVPVSVASARILRLKWDPRKAVSTPSMGKGWNRKKK